MIIFVDSGFMCVVAIVIVLGVLGTALSLAEWIAANAFLVLFFLFIKSLIFLSVMKANSLKQVGAISFTLMIPLEMLRTGIPLQILVEGVLSVFSGSFIHAIETIFALIIIAPLTIGTANISYIFIDPDDFSIANEILSILALGFLVFILYGVLGGW